VFPQAIALYVDITSRHPGLAHDHPENGCLSRSLGSQKAETLTAIDTRCKVIWDII